MSSIAGVMSVRLPRHRTGGICSGYCSKMLPPPPPPLNFREQRQVFVDPSWRHRPQGIGQRRRRSLRAVFLMDLSPCLDVAGTFPPAEHRETVTLPSWLGQGCCRYYSTCYQVHVRSFPSAPLGSHRVPVPMAARLRYFSGEVLSMAHPKRTLPCSQPLPFSSFVLWKSSFPQNSARGPLTRLCSMSYRLHLVLEHLLLLHLLLGEHLLILHLLLVCCRHRPYEQKSRSERCFATMRNCGLARCFPTRLLETQVAACPTHSTHAKADANMYTKTAAHDVHAGVCGAFCSQHTHTQNESQMLCPECVTHTGNTTRKTKCRFTGGGI